MDEGAADVKRGTTLVKRIKQRIDDGKDNIVKMKAVVALLVNKTLALERLRERQEMKYQTLFEQVSE